METFLFKADDEHLAEAAALLKSGEVVAIPTETVYGLAANALDASAVRKIFIAKGRPQDNPLILHIASLPMLYEIAEYVPETAERLAARFWPGPLTMIFPRRAHIPAETCGGLATVGVRMPRHSFTLKLIELCGFPLAAPSANTSGRPSPTSAAHVLKDMKGKIPMILDGGECTCGVESTVIAFEEGAIRVLRPGAVTAEALSEFADVRVDGGVLAAVDAGALVPSPGMKYKHYAPNARVALVEGEAERFYAFLDKKCAEGERIGVLCAPGAAIPPGCLRLPYGDTPEERAANLFASLRAADELGCTAVYVEKPSAEGVGLAVLNRLLRAAAFRVIVL
ncbi:MAG: L-threonylcarbamoyladenylate synthase [Bacteroides sp.]|nr:L-threonylcarbamoyladenylate synthase [Eubacterium sp.]MCM1417884.1 L-threonylcarbamoyladenylate synthase [Roseburia sp.]MCM1461952.1 L-threonylcarbamoyladenylate synthase [Bacteroides sp.]